MQNRYVGDVGDFGKYGLLRSLLRAAGSRRPRLAMLWWLTGDESHNDDGKHAGYLSGRATEAYRACDPELHELIAGIRHARHVSAVRRSGVFPADTLFHEEELGFEPGAPAAERRRHRAAWRDRARELSREAELLFFDPDNGLECQSVGPHAAKGPKYVFMDELTAIGGEQQSLVVYHHLGRAKSHAAQVKDVVRRLGAAFPQHEAPVGFHFWPGSGRVFVLVPAKRHRFWSAERAARVLAAPWGEFFSVRRA